MNIVIIGDSHAKGRLPDGSDSDLIAETLQCPKWCRLAKSGSTARQWLDLSNGWLEEAVLAASRPETEAVFVSLGGNDMFRDYADGVLTPLEGAAIVADIMAVLQTLPHSRIFLLVYGDPYKGGRLDATAAVLGIALAYRAIAAAFPWVTLVDESWILSPSDWCGTDIHPDASGYVKIANHVRRQLEVK